MSKISEIKEMLEVKEMADAFVDSSRRSRFIIIVMIFASVLTFVSFWNSQQGSWTRCRLRMAKYAQLNHCWELTGKDSLVVDSLSKVRVFEKRQLLVTCDSAHDYRLKNLDTLIEEGWNNWKNAESKDRVSLDSLSLLLKAEADSLRYAVNLCQNRGFHSDASLAQYIQDLDKLRTERVLLIQVPIFGVICDVNDLGVLGGLAFTVILLWFRFSLWQELRNLRLFFDQSRHKDDFRRFYHYLAMRQVLTIPRTFIDSPPAANGKFLDRLKKAVLFQPILLFYEFPARTDRRFWSIVEKGLFILPLVVQGIVFLHDEQTRAIGEIISKPLVNRGQKVSLFFLILIFILTVRCLWLSRHINKEWDQAFERLTLAEKKDQP